MTLVTEVIEKVELLNTPFVLVSLAIPTLRDL